MERHFTKQLFLNIENTKYMVMSVKQDKCSYKKSKYYVLQEKILYYNEIKRRTMLAVCKTIPILVGTIIQRKKILHSNIQSKIIFFYKYSCS